MKLRNMKLALLLNLLTIVLLISAKRSDDKNKPDWAKKNIRDYNDVDIERLLDQWEEDEEPLEPDELPEHLRPPAVIDMSKLDMNNPEGMLQATKKGKTLMCFVNVMGNPTKDEAETITKLWQTSLWNNHIQAERYMIGENRAIFMFKDGAQAWEAKDFLVDQDKCESVTIENKVYNGKFSGKKDEL